jgi:hypothetical protein
MSGIEEAETVELALQMIKKSNELCLRRRTIGAEVQARL